MKSTRNASALAHLRRRDHLVARPELVAGCVWWWSPLFWYARRQLRESAELASDAWAVWAMPDERRAYAEALVEVSLLVSHVRAPVPVLGVVTGARHTSYCDAMRWIVRLIQPACQLSLGEMPFNLAAACLADAARSAFGVTSWRYVTPRTFESPRVGK